MLSIKEVHLSLYLRSLNARIGTAEFILQSFYVAFGLVFGHRQVVH